MKVDPTPSQEWEIEIEHGRSFFNRKTCERCRKPIEDGRIMSMFNSETICLWCKEVEELHPDYEKACKAEKMATRRGLKYFCGIGVDKKELDKIERGC